MSADHYALAADIEALPTPMMLRLAADLLDLGKVDLGHAIAQKAVARLGAAIALAKLEKRRT